MESVPARFLLDDGEQLIVAEEDIRPVYELLWGLAPKPGALSMAAVMRAMERESQRHGPPMDLTPAQSDALREAVAQLRP